jgi:hypothetical protein
MVSFPGCFALVNLRESQVRLNDDIQPTRTYEAVGARERQAKLVHDFGDANSRRAGDAHATVYQGGGTIATASFCGIGWLVRIG